MKKVYLVHCWDGTIEDGWYLWLKRALENSNIEVKMENMPNTQTPSINEWVSKLDSLVNKLDEDTYFIGHSIGCQTIMRYLEIKEVSKIGGILFVAPWLDLLPEALSDGSDEIAKPWIETIIDFDKIKEFTNNITCIFSDDDYFVSLDQEKEFKNKLNARTVIINNKGHISGDDGIIELPIILNEFGKILEIEFLDIVDEKGITTNKIMDKNLIHDKNLLHNEVGVFIFNSKGETLIQKRSANKRFKPNMWAICAGHVDCGEDNLIAMQRELSEELGILLNLNELIKFNVTILERNENSHIRNEYYAFIDKDINGFKINEEELSEIKWIPFEQFKNMIVNNDPTITMSNNNHNLKTLSLLEEVLKIN